MIKYFLQDPISKGGPSEKIQAHSKGTIKNALRLRYILFGISKFFSLTTLHKAIAPKE